MSDPIEMVAKLNAELERLRLEAKDPNKNQELVQLKMLNVKFDILLTYLASRLG